jgi:hypothetical protein
MKKQEEFYESIKNNDIKKVTSLIKDSEVDITEGSNWAIQCASELGYKEILELLLNDLRTDPSDNENYALYLAATSDNIEIIELLLKNKKVLEKGNAFETIKALLFKKNYNMIEILWNNKTIKNKTRKKINTLNLSMSGNLLIYNYLKKIDIKNKLEDF